jgi:hypothetical protein
MHCTILIVTIFAYTINHVEPKTKIQVEQVHGVFGGPQTSSYEDANIVVTKTSPGASNHNPWALVIFVFYLWFLIVH